MRPLLGLENSNYTGDDAPGGGAAHEDDDGEGMVSMAGVNANTAGLVRALQKIQGRNEEDADDAMLDALCKEPGGACALPTNKGKQKQKKGKEAPTATPAAAPTAAAAAAPAASSEVTPMVE